jgi:uncharacterized protein with FMN-binding domain
VAAAAPAATTRAHSITGRAVSTRYGPVQVTIDVQGRRLISVGASAPVQQRREAQINERAVPALSREALAAQSAHIHTVSGATMTSVAFRASLASALRSAHL